MTEFKSLPNHCNRILPTIVLFEVIFVCLRKQVNTRNTVSREQYKDGCAWFVFDFTPQMDSSEVGFELIRHSNIRIEIHFANATARIFIVIVFAKNDNLREIDQDRNIAFDYTA